MVRNAAFPLVAAWALVLALGGIALLAGCGEHAQAPQPAPTPSAVRPTVPAAKPEFKAAAPIDSSDRVTVSIEDQELCPRYAAAVATVHNVIKG